MKDIRKPLDRHLESSLMYEPVAYDKSIEPRGDQFVAIVRMHDETMEFPYPTLRQAQRLLTLFKPDVCEEDVPWSVFCSVDDRLQTQWFHAKLEEEDAQLC